MAVTLDTSVLVDLVAGDPRTLAEVDRMEAGGRAFVLSSVAVFELLAGVEFRESRSERAKVEGLLR